MRRLLWLAASIAVIALAVGSAAVILAPPAALVAVEGGLALAWPVARGAYHVHSQRSDGTGTLDEIAAAAARAGLQFVIVTDHGNGRRAPEPAVYRAGVLCIDGVEISTAEGHYVALDLPHAPYPLAGRAREVIEDVRRLGGFGIAAHPGSPKRELQWHDWEAPFDGLEWLNADSEWRDEVWGSLGRTILTYGVRPVETLSSVLDRPKAVLERWTAISATRRVVGIAAADAHARLGFRQASDPYDDRVLARLPSYEVSFGAFSNHVVLNGPLTGDAATDADLILSAVREGRLFTSIDGLAALSAFEAKATSGDAVARPGEYLDLQGTAAIEARIAAPPGTRLIVVKDEQPLYEVSAAALRLDVGREAGAYRIEAHLPASLTRVTVPWVLTNPIYVGLREAHERATVAAALPSITARTPVATKLWRAEASAGSTSELRQSFLADGTPALEWSFALARDLSAPPYAAMFFPVAGELAAHDRLQLRAVSDRPRRLWAQLRVPGPAGGERWGTTFYVHDSLAPIELRWSDFRPLGPVTTARPPLDRADSLLLVVDTLNSDAGTAGRLSIPDLWFAR